MTSGRLMFLSSGLLNNAPQSVFSVMSYSSDPAHLLSMAQSTGKTSPDVWPQGGGVSWQSSGNMLATFRAFSIEWSSFFLISRFWGQFILLPPSRHQIVGWTLDSNPGCVKPTMRVGDSVTQWVRRVAVDSGLRPDAEGGSAQDWTCSFYPKARSTAALPICTWGPARNIRAQTLRI